MVRKKSLQEMSLEELWQLFPIILVPHNPSWKKWAEEEISLLNQILNIYQPKITHIGSTALPGIYAKPIIDILVETPEMEKWDEIKEILEAGGYIMMSRGGERMSFNKGYTEEGYAEKVFHIHFRVNGDNDEIMFRDFLMDNPSVAGDYETLKLSLVASFRNDRDGYTDAKTNFIRNILLMAEEARKADGTHQQFSETLAEKISLNKIKSIASWASQSDLNKAWLWKMSLSENRRISVNSLWVLTHLDKSEGEWVRSLQSYLIIRLLKEQDPSKKRLFLQLLKTQRFDSDHPLTIKLLDYCFSKINSECEAYAVRCFSIYVAFEICKDYPELITELEGYLNLLNLQSLSPGLKSGLRQTRHRIQKLKAN